MYQNENEKLRVNVLVVVVLVLEENDGDVPVPVVDDVAVAVVVPVEIVTDPVPGRVCSWPSTCTVTVLVCGSVEIKSDKNPEPRSAPSSLSVSG